MMNNRRNFREVYDDIDDRISLELTLSNYPKKIKHSYPPPSSSSSPLIITSQESMPIHSTTTLPLPNLTIYTHPWQTPNYIQFPPIHPLQHFMASIPKPQSPLPSPPPPPPPPPPPFNTISDNLYKPNNITHAGRGRRSNYRNSSSRDNNTGIHPPYPWATNRPAVSHNISYLLERQITNITGMARCSKCEKNFEVSYDLEVKVLQVGDFIVKHNGKWHDRAPQIWMNPTSLTCIYCRRETAKPIISENKETINWLFLFLGQMLGLCTLDQLKYFCGCTKNHRTGAKNRVLYLTYHEISKQLGVLEYLNKFLDDHHVW